MSLTAESQQRRWESAVQSSISTGRLQLRGASLDAGSAAQVVQLLLGEEKQPWLVDLEGNELGDQGALCLAELLRQSTDLVWLGLGACGIGPLGGVALASALSESRSLTALDLASSGAMSGPVRNSLGRKVRDGAPLTLPAAPTEEALHGGLSRRGKPRAAPPGAGLPRAPASSAPALAWAAENAAWAGAAPGPPEALLRRLGQGYLLSDAEMQKLSSAGEAAAALEASDPHFGLAARRWRRAHQPVLAQLLSTALPPDDGALGQPALKVLKAAPLQPRRQRPCSAGSAGGASSRGLPPEVPSVAVALIALAEAAAKVPTLAILKLGGNGVGTDGAHELCALLRNASGLTELHLARNGLGPAGVAALAPAAAAAASGSLRLLDLSLNEIGDGGACALALAFGGTATPVAADANANREGRDAHPPSDADADADCKPSLTSLYLGANAISARGAAALAGALGCGLRRLRCLSLQKNSLLPAGASALAAALPSSSLAELNLSGCHVSDQGATALAAALSEGARLTTLDLSGNGVGDGGAGALAACLPHATALQALLLGGNRIGDAGGVALGGALGEVGLRTLDLKHNGLGPGAGAALLRGVRSHARLRPLPSLTTLGVAGTEVPYASALRLETRLQAIRRNRDPARARLQERVVQLRGVEASLGQAEAELAAMVAEREANEAEVHALEAEVRRARASEAAAAAASAEEVRVALGLARAAEAALRAGGAALSLSKTEWEVEARELALSLRATERRLNALTARREAAAVGEEVAGMALSAELTGLVDVYRAAEAAASRAHDGAEYKLVRLKERVRALRLEGINVTVEEIPARLRPDLLIRF